MGAETVTVDELAREYGVPDFEVGIITTCEDPGINSIFKEEAEKAGVGHLDIALFVPLDPYNFPYSENFGNARRREVEGYDILLEIPPHIDNRFGLIHSRREVERFTIRHELAHIKNGDCDAIRGFRFPKSIREFRANWYASQAYDFHILSIG